MTPETIRERGLEGCLVISLPILEETLTTRDATLLLLKKTWRRVQALPEGVHPSEQLFVL